MCCNKMLQLEVYWRHNHKNSCKLHFSPSDGQVYLEALAEG